MLLHALRAEVNGAYARADCKRRTMFCRRAALRAALAVLWVLCALDVLCRARRELLSAQQRAPMP